MSKKRAVTDNANLFVVPVANPAGYYYANDMTNTTWRKNRRDTSTDSNPGTNYHWTDNDNIVPGVDLNRNWPTTDWGQDWVRTNFPGDDKQIGTSRFTNDNIYCGRPVGNSWTNNPWTPPINEKEITGLCVLSDSNAFHCVIDLHSHTGIVGWAENVDTNEVHLRINQGWSNDDQVVRLLAAKAADLIVDPEITNHYLPQTGPYPVSGDILWYHYDKFSSCVLPFLIEIAHTYQPSNATEHANAVLPGQLFLMFSAVDKSFAAKPTYRFRKP